MAGGRGTRFWPLSRNTRPKQLLNIVGDTTMLQMTVDRLRKIPAVKDIYIVTGSDLAETIRAEVKHVTPENIIVEPSGKNTAPCIGLAALEIDRQHGSSIIGIFPADHLVIGHHRFEKAFNTAAHLARKRSALVTIGIQPTFPATGYGYIQYVQKSDEDHLDAYRVRTFAEKPPLSLARKFMESGDFLWNSGMFVWETGTFFNELKLHMPDLSDSLKAIDKRRCDNPKASINGIWEEISAESIDYGLMEKSQKIYVIKANFEWNDVGSWNSVYEISPKSADKNVVRGDGIILEGNNNYIQSTGRFTAIVGADNLVVVNTEDATLVIPKSKVEKVKDLVELLEDQERKELL